MRADLALILFVLTLAGGIALLVLRKKRGGAPLLIGGIVLLGQNINLADSRVAVLFILRHLIRIEQNRAGRIRYCLCLCRAGHKAA